MAYSAIGWYVHYNAKNYIDYGTRPKKDGKKLSMDLTSYWSQIQDNIKTKIITRNFNATEIQTIEDKLNAYRKMITLNDSKEMQKVRDKIIELLKARFSNINESTVIDFSRSDIYNLNSSAIDKNIQDLQQTKQHIAKTFSGKQITYLNTVIEEFIKAYEYLDTIKSVDSYSTILKKLTKIDQAFTEVFVAQDKELREKRLVGIHTSKGLVTKASAEAAVQAIRTAIGLRDTESLSNATGTLEEYIETAAALAAKGFSAEEIVKYLEKTYTEKGGAHHTRGTTASSDLVSIGKKAAAALKNNDFIYKDSSGEYKYKTTYSSQQKLDVEFEYDIKGQTKTVGLNIKNYNLYSSKALKLVSGSPLSTFLFNIGDVDITNHYLNILATHPTYPAEFKRSKEIALNSLSYYLLWAAITGQGVGKTEGFADVFVVNNNKDKNGVRVFDINKLINNVMTKSPQSIILEPNNFKLKNTFVKGKNTGASVQSRLTNLIASTHAQKISVSLAPSALNL